MSEPGRRNLFLLLCAIARLHTGAHISQSFVNYPNWHLIDARSSRLTIGASQSGRHILGGSAAGRDCDRSLRASVSTNRSSQMADPGRCWPGAWRFAQHGVDLAANS